MKQIKSVIWNEQSGFQYNDETSNNDIVILKLSSPLSYNDNVQPACLPSSSNWTPENNSKNRCFVSGWGTTTPGLYALFLKLYHVFASFGLFSGYIMQLLLVKSNFMKLN